VKVYNQIEPETNQFTIWELARPSFDDQCIASFSPTKTAAVGCNNNAVFMGARGQAIGAMFYLQFYLTKFKTEVANALAVIEEAVDMYSKYGSSAADSLTDPETRSAKFILTRIINNLSGQQEISASQACSVLLENDSARDSSHLFWFCFPSPAVQTLLKTHFPNSLTAAGATSYPDTSSSDASSSESDTCEEPPDLDDPLQRLEDNGLDDSGEGIVELTRSSQGQLVHFGQHDYYAFRPNEFANMSLYEFAAIVDVIIPPKSTRDGSPEHGRRTNATFSFPPTAPSDIVKNRVLKLRSKQKIPILSAKQIRWPGKEKDTEHWRAAAKNYAIQVITLFFPWSQSQKPDIPDATFKCLVDWLQNISTNWRISKWIDRVRYSWIVNMSRGMAVDRNIKQAMNNRRGQDADKWNEPLKIPDPSVAEFEHSVEWPEGGVDALNIAEWEEANMQMRTILECIDVSTENHKSKTQQETEEFAKKHANWMKEMFEPTSGTEPSTPAPPAQLSNAIMDATQDAAVAMVKLLKKPPCLSESGSKYI
jgi:hypothetical protein